VSDLEVSGISHGVPLKVDFVTSALMQDTAKRGDQTFKAVELNDKFPTDSKQKLLDTIFQGFFYAWRDNDPHKRRKSKRYLDQFAELWKSGEM